MNARRGNEKTEYQKVIDEAVNYFSEHGFESAEKLAYWEQRIRQAAAGAMGATRTMEEMLRDVLTRTYQNMIAGGKLVRKHPGVPRWTIERVRPELRAELDRRIIASANLIRVKRKAKIEETLARFVGWASSQPKGGSGEADKADTKAKIKKPIASLPFEERRLLTDQGHKLVSAINDVVAVGGGAIGAIWHSRWRQPNYDYREDHKERDLVFYGVRDSWAAKAGLTKKPEAGWIDEITRPAEEPFCRCSYQYVYSLREIEKVAPEVLTAKGRASLEDARAKIKAMA